MGQGDVYTKVNGLYSAAQICYQIILAASRTVYKNAEGISGYGGGEEIAFADVIEEPRTLSMTTFDAEAEGPALYVKVVVTGINGRGEPDTETFELNGSETKIGDVAFSRIDELKVKVSEISGNGAGDTLSIGRASDLGLPSNIEEESDVFAMTRDACGWMTETRIAVVNTTHSTVNPFAFQLTGTITGTFVYGETVVGSGSGAKGKLLKVSPDCIYVERFNGAAFAAGDTVTGQTSEATIDGGLTVRGEALSRSVTIEVWFKQRFKELS